MRFFSYAIHLETLAYYPWRSDDHIQSRMRGSHPVSESAPIIATALVTPLVNHSMGQPMDEFRLLAEVRTVKDVRHGHLV